MAAHADLLVSVDWKNGTGISAHGLYSGVEPLAAAANPVFGAANDWNDPLLGYLSPETNPSFSNLLDSQGNVTSVGFQFTGVVDTYTGTDGSCPNTLMCDFIYLNGGALDWTITGLTPNSVNYMYFYNYGSAAQSYRVFNMALDTDGNGSLDGNFTVDAVNGVYAAPILASPTGTISGEMQCCLSGQASWSGFQIDEQTAPEPASLVLFAGGMVLLGALRKRRGWPA
jgi:hypothetical protein